MTQQQRKDELLASLLDAEGDTTQARPGLTRYDEQRLLAAANRAPIPTLAPEDYDQHETFGGAVATLVRRHPLPVLAATVGLAYMLSRRRR